MVDKSLILRKLSTLDEYLKQINEFADISLKDYAADWKIQRIVERTLQMMIETCLLNLGRSVEIKRKVFSHQPPEDVPDRNLVP